MLDQLGREINYLRISVTDRCNLRCRYCMPPEGISLKEHRDILSFEEIEKVVRIGAELGITKIRLTGGEPLIRRNLADLVYAISRIDGIDDVAITTNGILFPGLAAELKEAGLKRVNISLDTLQKDRYHYITRGGDITAAFNALETALAEGLEPVKVNTVLINGFNDDEILDFCRLAFERPLHIRFIEFMPVGEIKYWHCKSIIKNSDVFDIISKHYVLKPGKISRGSGPAKYFVLDGGRGSVGFISPMSNHFCSECNRLRLTADGKLRACLYGGKERDLKEALRNNLPDEEIRRIFVETVLSKPERHTMGDKPWGTRDRKMYQIGG
ncbi:MAG: GTP 3',8-cyclase MoaA [Syntrophomonadaceae bacterium]|jgi:cyclic pyranopterin phosphate synthase|nr:GTP 3',8-cyclase MoaA [Syntrophomonadaceae bacterium]